MSKRAWTMAAALGLALAALAASPGAALASGGRVIRVTSTIQAAVDKARPGDTVVVPPGVYHESVLITTSHLTLRGSHAAVIDARGFDNGIRVGAGEQRTGPDGFPRCPKISVRDVTVDGLTVRNADDNGIFLIGVDGFTVRGGRYLDNHEYGVFPSCSSNGLIAGNFARGANDTAFYVGNDTHVTVTGNRASGNTSAYEVENSSFVVERGNQASGNTAGILVFVLPSLPRTRTSHVLVEHNVYVNNNRPNPVSPTSGEDIGLVPTGTGVLDVAADDVTIRDNVISGNDTVGVAIITTPFAGQDPRVEPFPDRARVVGNVILRNGQHPDLLRSPMGGADVLYDGSGTGNCFARNRYATDLPPGVVAAFPCG
jgi:parallel beta-helix repeat protein